MPLHVDAINVSHCTSQPGGRCVQEQVVMIPHQAVGMTLSSEALVNITKQVQEYTPKLVVWKYAATTGAAIHYVIPSAVILDT